MQHFPIFLSVVDQRIILSGGGNAALAKLRILLKTEANIVVFAANAAREIQRLALENKLTLKTRAIAHSDIAGAALFYAANENAAEDMRVAEIARKEGVLVNIVDNLADSQFITPAIVDRDPVVVAIGTEGAAPVLARAIKADIEASLPTTLGLLARIGKSFRHAADVLPMGRKRRQFWSDYYFKIGPKAVEIKGISVGIETLLDHHIMTKPSAGNLTLIGAGPGDPELLTLKARRALDTADVVIHDVSITPQILDLARREATIIAADLPQAQINALITSHAKAGAHIVRLKLGSPSQSNAESAVCAAENIPHYFIPGVSVPAGVPVSMPKFRFRRGATTTRVQRQHHNTTLEATK